MTVVPAVVNLGFGRSICPFAVTRFEWGPYKCDQFPAYQIRLGGDELFFRIYSESDRAIENRIHLLNLTQRAWTLATCGVIVGWIVCRGARRRLMPVTLALVAGVAAPLTVVQFIPKGKTIQLYEYPDSYSLALSGRRHIDRRAPGGSVHAEAVAVEVIVLTFPVVVSAGGGWMVGRVASRFTRRVQ